MPLAYGISRMSLEMYSTSQFFHLSFPASCLRRTLSLGLGEQVQHIQNFYAKLFCERCLQRILYSTTAGALFGTRQEVENDEGCHCQA